MAHSGNGVGEAAAEKILVSDGHDGFASAGTERGNAVGVRRIEQPGALEVEHGMQPDLAIGLGRERKAPAAVAGLERLIGNRGDRLPFRTAELLPSQMPVGIFKLLLTAMLPLLSVGGRKIQDCTPTCMSPMPQCDKHPRAGRSDCASLGVREHPR